VALAVHNSQQCAAGLLLDSSAGNIVH